MWFRSNTCFSWKIDHVVIAQRKTSRSLALQLFTWCLSAGKRFLLRNVKMTERANTTEESSCKGPVACLKEPKVVKIAVGKVLTLVSHISF